ncbi:hypothetical protein TNCT_202881 [Trichonephila clavata]|uniref:Uncharacterized protein n=1 Tax=Trichonephila clavata TaxID=2740835 RepID=A0A8X6LY02_TRICU|nr:hypothetical protein TNCT_202881 [Trichonephila clavata]
MTSSTTKYRLTSTYLPFISTLSCVVIIHTSLRKTSPISLYAFVSYHNKTRLTDSPSQKRRNPFFSQTVCPNFKDSAIVMDSWMALIVAGVLELILSY